MLAVKLMYLRRLTGFYRDTVVVNVDVNVVDVNALAGIDIDSVRTGDVMVRGDLQIFRKRIFAVQEEQAPYGLVVKIQVHHANAF